MRQPVGFVFPENQFSLWTLYLKGNENQPQLPGFDPFAVISPVPNEIS